MKILRVMIFIFYLCLALPGCSGSGGGSGSPGPSGNNGLSINWEGPHINEADRLAAHGIAAMNDAYYNITDSKSYIYNSASWDILTQDGYGTNGSSVNWQGSYASEGDRAAAHGAPQVNVAYYNSTDKKAYIYNGTSWNILSQDGAPGVGQNGTSIVWQGSHSSEADRAAAHGAPQLNAAYYNSTDKTSYIYNGTSWDILAQDGLTGPTGPAGPGITWVNVTGISVQAEPNKGYIANNTSQVTITLPASLVIGDIIEVTGAGSGGWRIAQNAGQTIMAENLVNKSSIGDIWTPRESVRNWIGVASSSDGTKIVAVVNNGQIYTSTDSGVTWTPRNPGNSWNGVASSSDGTNLVAISNNGQIYTSTDSGVSWTPRESSRTWRGVASSSDGTKLVACVAIGQIYTSTDSGVNWTPRDSSRQWWSVAISSDGTKLVAVVAGGQIYTSTDSGVTWIPRESARSWIRVAISSDGTKLAAVVASGQIYTSSVKSSTTTGTSGYIAGYQYDSISLQYIGNNTFTVKGHEGELDIN